MDLGALVCTPKAPACWQCPWHADCRVHRDGLAEELPRRAEKRPRPLKRGAAFVVRDGAGAILLERRPEKGLLGSMLQPPMTHWAADFPGREEALRQAPLAASWTKLAGFVRHGFTHFELEMEVYGTTLAHRVPLDGRLWVAADEIGSAALPTVMRKILALATQSNPRARRTIHGAV
jgi:A/G-specific adenine glycosylase